MKSLFTAWQTVRESGSQSSSLELRNSITTYERELLKNLGSLQRQLSRGNFSFSPIKGILLKKGKDKRPIGIANIDDRILQRALLNTLMTVKELERAINNPNSFGGNKDGGVSKALNALNQAIELGATSYIKTDIKRFFGTIPRTKALNSLFKFLPDDDPSINSLLTQAVECELENANAKHIQEYINLFPKYDVGVVQGCCLSPILGNILLHDFDNEQKNRSTTCLRYIDDFIIVGQEADIRGSFKLALKTLSKLELDVFRLNEKDTKCEQGFLKAGVKFLGCHIRQGGVRPSKESKEKLLGALEEMFGKSVLMMRERKDFNPKKHAYSSVLNNARLKIKGWADAYHFCNDTSYLLPIDRKIAEMLDTYMKDAHRIIQNQSKEEDKRLLLGFQSVISKT